MEGTPQPVETSTPQTIQQAPVREGVEEEETPVPPNRYPREIGLCLPLRKHRKGGREIPLILCLRLLLRQHPPDRLDHLGPRIGLARGQPQTIPAK